MIEIKEWMNQYQSAVRALFGRRIMFIGLQGSYGRGEARDNSDIDVVLILDKVSLPDLKDYKKAIDSLPYSSLICGFVSGKEELEGWLKADLFQLYYDTTPYFGNMDSLVPAPAAGEARSAVLMGACNIYHMCSHNYLHGRKMGTLKNLYKTAFFVLQAKYCFETGVYLKDRKTLGSKLTGADLDILQYADKIKTAAESLDELIKYTEPMLDWTHRLICDFKELN